MVVATYHVLHPAGLPQILIRLLHISSEGPKCGSIPCDRNFYITVIIFGGEKTNKHKQFRGIVQEMGVGQIVYVFPFFLGKRETHKQNSQEISKKGRDNPGTIPGKYCLCVFLFIGFPGPNISPGISVGITLHSLYRKYFSDEII